MGVHCIVRCCVGIDIGHMQVQSREHTCRSYANNTYIARFCELCGILQEEHPYLMHTFLSLLEGKVSQISSLDKLIAKLVNQRIRSCDATIICLSGKVSSI